MTLPNFLELVSVEETNKVDLNLYTFLERLSATKGLYIFKIREKKR
jgi:hypothetical protein